MSESLTFLCKWCKEPIPNPKTNKLYCSRKCKNKKFGQIRQGFKAVELSTGTAGAIAEMLVSANLLQRGLPVFRALSPSCPCDLAILYEGNLLGVEVRTGYRNVTGSGVLHFSKKFQSGADIFAVYCPVDDSFYFQPITKNGEKLIQEIPKAWKDS